MWNLQVGLYGFNTQPPEGGWAKQKKQQASTSGFNTQPPEGGWLIVAAQILRP